MLIQYDRTLLVADPRRCEPKKFGGPGKKNILIKVLVHVTKSLIVNLLFGNKENFQINHLIFYSFNSSEPLVIIYRNALY